MIDFERFTNSNSIGFMEQMVIKYKRYLLALNNRCKLRGIMREEKEGLDAFKL